MAGDDDHVLLRLAARSSALGARRGAVFLRGDASASRRSSADVASRTGRVLSGAAALARMSREAPAGPSILWSDDVGVTSSVLADTHAMVSSGFAMVTVPRFRINGMVRESVATPIPKRTRFSGVVGASTTERELIMGMFTKIEGMSTTSKALTAAAMARARSHRDRAPLRARRSFR